MIKKTKGTYQQYMAFELRDGSIVEVTFPPGVEPTREQKQ